MSNMSYKLRDNSPALLLGMKHGIPIGLGYFAVAFSLGIAAKKAGLSAGQGFLASFLCNASAGEYVGFTLIAAGAGYWEMALATLVANARYLLMSCAVSQQLSPTLPMAHRFMMAYGITDELFGITVMRAGYLNPYYTYGAMMIALPSWAIGTMFGVMAGNVLPLRLVSALGVALYGMFLAVIIPASKSSKTVFGLVLLCFGASAAAKHLPYIEKLSEGTRTILLTVVIASAAAILFPREEEDAHET